MPETNGTARLDQMERTLQLLIDDHVQFSQEHKLLLTAQVLLTGHLDRFIQVTTETQKRTDEKLGELADKLNGLIGYIAGLPTTPPPQQT
jgi:hypothetical protein